MDSLYGSSAHSLISQRLLMAVRSGRVLNSYVFEGAAGIGKKTMAELFAAALVCEGKAGQLPCGSCPACRKVFTHNHPDVIYLEKTDGKKTIGIDAVRERILEQVYIRPLLADKKIFLITDGGALTEESQNSLLKALEEPPEYAVFIILTEKAGML